MIVAVALSGSPGIGNLIDAGNDLVKESLVEDLDDTLKSLPRLCQGPAKRG